MDFEKKEHPEFPTVNKAHVEQVIVPELSQWCLTNGVALASSENVYTAVAAPTTVFPTPVPRAAYQSAKQLQKPFNKLYAQIANSKWLLKETKSLAKADPEFTGRLFKLYEDRTAKSKQTLKYGIFRSDYLIDHKTASVKQVEFNTVSVSFGGLSSKVGELHSYLNVMGKYDVAGKSFYEPGELHVSESIVFLVKALAAALTLYKVDTEDTAAKREQDDKVVLFVVEPKELNLYDQKLLEYNLLKLYGINSLRATLDEVKTEFTYGRDNRLVHKKTGKEAGVVYYRTGYDVRDYAKEDHWDARGFLEESFAVKAPDLSVQLAGTKKIQQLLTEDKVISKFVDDAKTKKELMDSFVKIYPLDNSEQGKLGKKLALEKPENYVLKPQREGGGHNVYKKDIPAFLKGIKEDEWDAYILMELIDAKPTTKNFIVRDGKLSTEPIISELGIYGSIIFDGDNIHMNDYSGSLLRSKLVSSNEGGVVAGFGCIDSMYLMD
ncbi:glutathione synthase KNAG_0L00490 [Huiozyma naganishii CBS 8797]|uniref:Glutathione synthetase n=1 Tax=Huiozyma naganishii (strain ATCC MYA-139 / BCRC 22969 / CBS 8797 / KCTC 17520 / NBRC 10181 / NCYC 3082 / Yp74L-3) TaxID=1071383 RepID=J7S3K0_HUIN7|nr:hypothetical protein KNAG_0L00490 [Kazachstania naganishii CBS 8797]CCK72672.1 hypothetical protein KNAG_0L00490 [Kazachstania naganishii CBS 8797]